MRGEGWDDVKPEIAREPWRASAPDCTIFTESRAATFGQRKDLAIKVVGVGSVGTFCAVVLMIADVDDPKAVSKCTPRARDFVEDAQKESWIN